MIKRRIPLVFCSVLIIGILGGCIPQETQSPPITEKTEEKVVQDTGNSEFATLQEFNLIQKACPIRKCP
ncbi:hypothetical protein [Pseudalkalibacillus caeni]|uniref:Uncharacterized protein n=1 Tax=Exobacillus caeni TaxID=2574798 RepID=A0A5R9F3U8_9BACL|nr:hypothetical protein [Pseudalkalibacillus caeni]TLS37070.1 hypothetical protein FCL54_11100 [Pseudalkalibacillus caeni]